MSPKGTAIRLVAAVATCAGFFWLGATYEDSFFFALFMSGFGTAAIFALSDALSLFRAVRDRRAPDATLDARVVRECPAEFADPRGRRRLGLQKRLPGPIGR